MKGFWAGALAALVAGLLVLGITEAYSAWKSARSKVLELAIEDRAVIFDRTTEQILGRMQRGQHIAKVHLRNSGTQDLEDVDIYIADQFAADGSHITGFGIFDAIGESSEIPRLAISQGTITVSYDVMRRNSGVTLWIANRGLSRFQVSNNVAGLEIDEVSQYDSAEEELWNIVWYIGLAFGAFMLGVIVAEVSNRHVLRRIGLDPDEVAKLYAGSGKST